MAANKFILKGHDVRVDYTIGVTPGIPAFIYEDKKISKDFPSSAVHTDKTELGNLVTVPLEVTVDEGGTTFSVFYPPLTCPRERRSTSRPLGSTRRSEAWLSCRRSRL